MNSLSVLMAAALALGSDSQPPLEDDDPYLAEGQYTAIYSQARAHWRLLPIDGADRVVASACPQDLHLPRGVWLINQSEYGEPELIAPSGVALPPGHRARIALASCDSASTDALRAPADLVAWLVEHTGAVLVDE